MGAPSCNYFKAYQSLSERAEKGGSSDASDPNGWKLYDEHLERRDDLGVTWCRLAFEHNTNMLNSDGPNKHEDVEAWGYNKETEI